MDPIKMTEEQRAYEARLRRQLGHIMDFHCGQSFPDLPTYEVRALHRLGFINDWGDLTPEGLEFLEAG